MLHFPPILAGSKSHLDQFHRPSTWGFLIFILQGALVSVGVTLLPIEQRFNFVTEGIMVTAAGGLGILLHLMAIYTMVRGVTGCSSSSISGGSKKHFFSLSTRLLAPIDIVFLVLGRNSVTQCHKNC